MPSARSPLSSHVLVVAQLAGVAAACWPVGLVNRGPAAALVLAALGAVLGLVVLAYNRPGNFSIYPEPKPGLRLVTDGPYAVVRHPMYAALVTMMIGVAAFNGHLANFLGAALTAVAVAGKALREERLLAREIPGYLGYRARTRWRIVPYVF